MLPPFDHILLSGHYFDLSPLIHAWDVMRWNVLLVNVYCDQWPSAIYRCHRYFLAITYNQTPSFMRHQHDRQLDNTMRSPCTSCGACDVCCCCKSIAHALDALQSVQLTDVQRSSQFHVWCFLLNWLIFTKYAICKNAVCLCFCLSVCLSVWMLTEESTNRNRCTQRLVILHAQTF